MTTEKVKSDKRLSCSSAATKHLSLDLLLLIYACNTCGVGQSILNFIYKVFFIYIVLIVRNVDIVGQHYDCRWPILSFQYSKYTVNQKSVPPGPQRYVKPMRCPIRRGLVLPCDPDVTTPCLCFYQYLILSIT